MGWRHHGGQVRGLEFSLIAMEATGGFWWGTHHKQAKRRVMVWIQSHDALNWILAGEIVGCVILEI